LRKALAENKILRKEKCLDDNTLKPNPQRLWRSEMSCTGNDEQAICDQIDGGLYAEEQMCQLFDDWWELVGSKMKNEPGENIGDTELPLRVARAAWIAVK